MFSDLKTLLDINEESYIMPRIIDSFWFRTTALILIISFMLLDVSWAYPVDQSTFDSLAPYTSFQNPKLGRTFELGAGLAAVTLDIANYRFGDEVHGIKELPLDKLAQTLRMPRYGVSYSLEGIDVDRIAYTDGGLLIPYAYGDKQCIIQVAVRGTKAADDMVGTEIGDVLSKRYLVKIAERRAGFRADLLESAVKANRVAFIMLKVDGVKDKKAIFDALKKSRVEIVYEGAPIRFSRAMAEAFYAEHRGKHYFDGLIGYMTEGGVIPVIVRSYRDDAIEHVREVVGPTAGVDKVTKKVAIGTIRGDLMTDGDRAVQPIRNRIHASDSIVNVVREASIVFGEERLDRLIDSISFASGPAGTHGSSTKGNHCRIDTGDYQLKDVTVEDGAQLIRVPDASTLVGVTVRGGASDRHQYSDGSVFADLRGGVIKFDSARAAVAVTLEDIEVPSSYTLMDQNYLNNTIRTFGERFNIAIATMPFRRIDAHGEALYLVHSSYAHPDKLLLPKGAFMTTSYRKEFDGFAGHKVTVGGTLYLDEAMAESEKDADAGYKDRGYLIVPEAGSTRVVIKLREGGYLIRVPDVSEIAIAKPVEQNVEAQAPVQFDLKAAADEVGNIAKNLAGLWDRDMMPIRDDAQMMLTGKMPLTPEALGDIKARYAKYLEGGDWQKTNSARYKLQPDERVAYFCLEYGLTELMNTYGGGLGILAGDHLRGASDRYSENTFVAVGMAWKKGYFKQDIKGGRQTEDYKVIDFVKYGERVRVAGDDGKETDLVIKIEAKVQDEFRDGKKIRVQKYIYAKAWRVRVGRVELYLLDTDIDENKNPEMNPLLPNPHDITANLYLADDREWRFKQEYLLGIGGMRLLQELGIQPAALHLNEGHAAFAAVEFVKRELEKRARTQGLSPLEAADIRKNNPARAKELGIEFSQAIAAVKPRVGFTSHTPIAAGNEMFEHWIVEPYFRNYCDLHGIEINALIGLCVERGWMTANLSRLAISLSADVTPEEAAKELLERMVVTRNGVSFKGGEVSKHLYGDKSFGHITNAVSRQFWQAPLLRELLESRWVELQSKGIVPQKRIEELSKAERQKYLKTLLTNITDDELMRTTKRMKDEAVEHLAKIRGVKLDKDAFTIVVSRRFALYKRLGMILDIDDWKTVMAENFEAQILDRLIQSARENGLPLQVVFAGKAHPQDKEPQDIIAKIWKAMEVSRWKDVIKFVPDYDIEVAKDLIQIATVWENNPIPPQEASGTSGMKAALNGDPNVSTPDGWPLEADYSSTVFLFGREGRYEDLEKVRDRNVRRELDARDLRELEELYTGQWRDQGTDHEKGIINMYRHHPERWAQRKRGTILDAMVNFDTTRLLEDYETKMYLPLVQGGRVADLYPNRMAEASLAETMAAESWRRISQNPLLMVAISSMQELGRRNGVTDGDFFDIVEAHVPRSMPNLLQAMGQLRKIAERPDVTDGEISASIRTATERYALSFDEESILWLAMTGPARTIDGKAGGNEIAAPDKAAKEADEGTTKAKTDMPAPGERKPVEQNVESSLVSRTDESYNGRRVTQLFEIVEGTVNNERAMALDAANGLNALLAARVDSPAGRSIVPSSAGASAADVRRHIEDVVSAAESMYVKDMPAQVRETVETLRKGLDRLEADSIVSAVIAMARRAKFDRQNIIIGLETGWIPGYDRRESGQRKAMQALVQEIDSLGETLRTLGLDNVTVIHKSKDDLASSILEEARRTNTKLSNVVVLGSSRALNSESFAPIRSTPEEERAFLAGIDTTELDRYTIDHPGSIDVLNVKVMEMLAMAMELAAGREPPQSPIIINYDRKLRTVVFLPKAEPIDFDEYLERNKAEVRALQSA